MRVTILIAMLAIGGCGTSAEIVENLSAVELEEFAGAKKCWGTVDRAFAKPPTETGFACTDAECAVSNPSGTRLAYACDGESCPITVGGTNARASCTVSGQVYARACQVSFSSVDRRCQ